MDDFELACRGLYRALTIREKYMRLAFQRFPRTASQYLRQTEGESFGPEEQLEPGDNKRRSGLAWFEMILCRRCVLNYMSHLSSVFTSPPKEGEDPFDVKNLPKNLGYVARMKDGVIYVYNDAAAADKHQPKDMPYPDLNTFIDDMNFLIALIAQGPTWVL